jgi:methylated-DNA-protein-cysteine methyltransferase-like protein
VTPFQRKVAKAIKQIPRGTTRGYGEIALRAGKPRGARAVVSALRKLDDVPWWRVARSDGTLAPQVAGLQSQLLKQEGWRPKRRRK